MKSIIPLLCQMDEKISKETLSERISEMINQGYQCVGVYHKKELIGISGMWITTRYYCGKFIEPDNVIIDKKHRNKGIGKKLMSWIYNYAQENGCIWSELSAYVTNPKAHKFYLNEGYDILGYRFCRKLKDSG